MKRKDKQRGISLISLVITIIIILILTASIIITLLADSPIYSAKEATIKSDIKTMQENYELAYSKAYIKNLGEESGIKNSDFADVVPEKYDGQFKAGKYGIIYIGYDETIAKIALEMGIEKKEFNAIEEVLLASKFTTIDIQTTIVEGEIIDEYVYQIREKGTEEWLEFSSNENKITIENLNQDVQYEIKVIAKQSEKQYESTIQVIKTKREVQLGTLIMKINDANGDSYSENTWTNENIYVQVEGENTTYSATGANTVSETTTPKILESEGITTIILRTKSDEDEKTQNYTVKIDKSDPIINEVKTNNIGTTRDDITITVKAVDELSGIVGYQFSEDENITENSEGWNEIENTKEEIENSYTVSENGIYYFYAKDEAENITKEEIIISDIDRDAPILESIGVTAPESGDYIDGQEITIEAVYDEELLQDNTVLKIKFGTGEERQLEKGVISKNKITYKYVIKEDDLGVLATTSYSGTVQDKVGNELKVSDIELTGNKITAIWPQLQAWTSNATTDFHAEEYRTKITKAVLKDNVEVPEGVTFWDVSKDGNGSVVAYVEDDGNGGYILTIGGKGKILANTNSSNLFKDFTVLTEIENLELLDTSQSTDMTSMFNGCTNLTSLDVSGFDTSQVTTMSGMFMNCSVLKNLDIENFDVSKVSHFGQMFGGCKSLTSLDVSKWDTSQATYMAAMFQDCSSLTNLDVSKFNTSQVTTMNRMFNNCSNLIEIDVKDWDTSQVTNMEYMFSTCSKLISLDVSKWNTGNVKLMGNMFSGCSGLTNLDVSKFDTSQVTNMAGMFNKCSSLTKLDVSGFNTSQVTNMGNMFGGCSGLTSLDVSGFDTSQVTHIGWMFNGCSGVTSLNFSKWDTTQVIEMQQMFENCSSLQNLDLRSFDTSKIKVMTEMFNNCSLLTSLDVSSFNTSNVTHMSSMFSGCSSLTSLDVSNFDTSQVTNMGSMFYNCKSLISLDLSKFDTSQVTSMGWMFRNCTNLKTLNLGTFDTSQVKSMENMFERCSNLTLIIPILYNNVTSYTNMFNGAATVSPAEIIVDYTEETSDLVDKMVETKSSTSNVRKADEPTVLEPSTENANIVATVNKDSEGTVTGVYINASDENGIETLTILNASNEIVEEIQVEGATTYSSELSITEVGTYEVQLLNSIGETKKVTFEI